MAQLTPKKWGDLLTPLDASRGVGWAKKSQHHSHGHNILNSNFTQWQYIMAL